MSTENSCCQNIGDSTMETVNEKNLWPPIRYVVVSKYTGASEVYESLVEAELNGNVIGELFPLVGKTKNQKEVLP